MSGVRRNGIVRQPHADDEMPLLRHGIRRGILPGLRRIPRPAAAGRQLDFLCQEILREINTTGSKCSDAEIARTVVEFKSVLETIREQVQNFE